MIMIIDDDDDDDDDLRLPITMTTTIVESSQLGRQLTAPNRYSKGLSISL